jgi:hypothetical protein
MGHGASNNNCLWIYEPNPSIEALDSDIGRWVFIFPNSLLSSKWLIIKSIYNSQIIHIYGAKCSNSEHSYSKISTNGIISVYLTESNNEKQIMKNGRFLLEILQYPFKTINYKINNPPYHNGSYITDHLYCLENPMFINTCVYCNSIILNPDETSCVNCDIKFMIIKNNTLFTINESPLECNFIRNSKEGSNDTHPINITNSSSKMDDFTLKDLNI